MRTFGKCGELLFEAGLVRAWCPLLGTEQRIERALNLIDARAFEAARVRRSERHEHGDGCRRNPEESVHISPACPRCRATLDHSTLAKT
ncbi:hypothetical protein NOVOSPHI9U_420195 [Novosphingobium sp. 9U]|nr:hypothetical protein NOVOSPHI9U_420195 [Novosphingobium sp. 9U]